MIRKEKRLVSILAVILAVLFATSFAGASGTEYTTVEVVVQEGDTLWGIWEEMGYGRFDAWHLQVKKLNDKDLSVLQPYDRVTIAVVK